MIDHQYGNVRKSTPNPLLVLRARVDVVDNQIMQLVKNRLELSKEIGQIKKAEGLEVMNRQRENAVLAGIRIEARRLGMPVGLVVKLFRHIFGMCRGVQTAGSKKDVTSFPRAKL